MNDLRLLIIGTNFISDRLCDAVSRVEGISVYAVYSRKIDTGMAFAKKYGIERVYDSLETALADKMIDAVYVASPTFLHSTHTIMALREGKHVLCEKSLASSYSEALEMRKCAKDSGRVLLEAMRPAFDPAFDLIKSEISRLGVIRRAQLQFCKYSSRYDNYKRGIIENAFDPKIKNSALSDIGVYPLWLCIALFGEPKDIISDKIFLDNNFLAMGCSVLTYGSMSAIVSYSKITEESEPSFIEGEEGTLFIDKISEPRSLYVKPRIGEPYYLDYTPSENNMVCELRAFIDMIKAKTDYAPYLDTSLSVMKIADKIHLH